jgi:hypothetical protein
MKRTDHKNKKTNVYNEPHLDFMSCYEKANHFVYMNKDINFFVLKVILDLFLLFISQHFFSFLEEE